MEKSHSILAPLVVFGPPIRVGMHKSTITPPTAAPDSDLLSLNIHHHGKRSFLQEFPNCYAADKHVKSVLCYLPDK